MNTRPSGRGWKALIARDFLTRAFIYSRSLYQAELPGGYYYQYQTKGFLKIYPHVEQHHFKVCEGVKPRAGFEPATTSLPERRSNPAELPGLFQCGGRDLNPRSPTAQDLKSCAFGQAPPPPQGEAGGMGFEPMTCGCLRFSLGGRRPIQARLPAPQYYNYAYTY